VLPKDNSVDLQTRPECDGVRSLGLKPRMGEWGWVWSIDVVLAMQTGGGVAFSFLLLSTYHGGDDNQTSLTRSVDVSLVAWDRHFGWP
jgi:hypothetical protein